MAKNSIFKLSLAALVFAGCGGGGSDSENSSDQNLEGSWSGAASVSIFSGVPACGFFAGEYPINWTLSPVDTETYSVNSEGFEIATAEAVSDTEAVAQFTEVHNVLSDTGDACLGEETVIMTLQPDGSLKWQYNGNADCGASGECVYGGEGLLNKPAS